MFSGLSPQSYNYCFCKLPLSCFYQMSNTVMPSLTTGLLQPHSRTHKKSSSFPLRVAVLETGIQSSSHPTEGTEGQSAWEPFQSDVGDWWLPKERQAAGWAIWTSIPGHSFTPLGESWDGIFSMGTAFLQPWLYFLALRGWLTSKLFQ